MSNSDPIDSQAPESGIAGDPGMTKKIHGQGSPGQDAAGCGPETDQKPGWAPYHHPTAGWGATLNVGKVLVRQRALADAPSIIFRMNHENKSFDCPGCAWPDDGKVHLDICENGVKHAAWV